MKFTREMILCKVIVLVQKVKNCTFDISEDCYQLPLTGKKMNLEGYQMVMLFLEIMEEFEVKIQKEDVIHYRFNTINGIVDEIEKKMKLKKR